MEYIFFYKCTGGSIEIKILNILRHKSLLWLHCDRAYVIETKQKSRLLVLFFLNKLYGFEIYNLEWSILCCFS
jgi:hypothetical protein